MIKVSLGLTVIAVLLNTMPSMAQKNVESLNIDSCYLWAEANYPNIKKFALIEKSRDYSIQNASRNYLPKINIGGQATTQSDVTKVPVEIPGLNIPSLSVNQYRVYTEVNQSITNMFTVDEQQDLAGVEAEIEIAQLEIELQNIKQKVNDIFFGIITLSEHIDETKLLRKDLENGIDRVEVSVKNGTATESRLSELEAELLKLDQKTIELNSMKKAYQNMLSLFIDVNVTDSTKFEIPLAISQDTGVNRAEVYLFDSQRKALDVQDKLVKANAIPNVSLFVQSGYGLPGLNMLNTDPAFYYIGGVRLSWNVSTLYTQKNDRAKIAVNQNNIDVQKETFLYNLNQQMVVKQQEIVKLQDLIKSDSAIINLREEIKVSSESQLELGVITVNDYLSSVYAADQARLNLKIHEIMLVQAWYNYRTLLGN